MGRVSGDQVRLQLDELIISVCRGENAKNWHNLNQYLTGGFQSFNCIRKSCRLGIRNDGLDFVQLLDKTPFKRRRVMFDLDLFKWRQLMN